MTTTTTVADALRGPLPPVGYALSDGVIALRSQHPLVAPDAPTTWVHVAMEGEWHGHPSGAFEFTQERFAEIIRNFNRQQNAVPVYFGHPELAPQIPGHEAEAKAWIHDYETRTRKGVTHLYALVEFGDEATDAVKRGGFRFCSGVFDFKATDRKTGEPIGAHMRNLALVNEPFIDGQDPIHLSQRAARVVALENRMTTVSVDDVVSKLEELGIKDLSPEDLAKIAEILKLESEIGSEESAPEEPAPAADKPEPAPAAPMSDKPAEEPVAASDQPPVTAEEPPPEAEEVPAAAGDAGAMLMAGLMEATGMAEAEVLAAWEERKDEVVRALQGALSEAESAPMSDAKANVVALSTKLAAQETTIKALSDRVREYEKRDDEERTTQAKADVDELIEKGLLAESARDTMESLALSDRKSFDALATSLKPVVPTGAHASGTEVAPPRDNTDAEDIADEDVDHYVATYLKNLPGKPKTPDELRALARQTLSRIRTKNPRRVAQ